MQTEKFNPSMKPTTANVQGKRAETESERRARQVMDEWAAQFKKDDARYREMRKDLKALEGNLKQSKRFLNDYKKLFVTRESAHSH
jgi:Skp family chaperone for outer membrane proteins